MKKWILFLVSVMCLVTLCVTMTACRSIASWMDKMAGLDKEEDTGPVVEHLATPSLYYNNGVLTWPGVLGATRYRIRYTNTETYEPAELVVHGTSLDLETLELPIGEFLFVVRAEDEKNPSANGDYTPDERGVRVTINSHVSLDDVVISLYYYDATTLLCTWTTVTGAVSYHVSADGNTSDSTTNYALLQADATKDTTVTLTVTGKPGYPYEGLSKSAKYVASGATTVEDAAYDKHDEALTLHIPGVTTVILDGQILNVSGNLTQVDIPANILRELSTGNHYMQVKSRLATQHYLLSIEDTRELVFVNSIGNVITSLDRAPRKNGLSVSIAPYCNTIRGIAYDGTSVASGDYTLSGDSNLTLAYSVVEAAGEGAHTLTVYYENTRGVALSATLQLQVSLPTAQTYDVATEGNLTLNGVPAGTTAVYGGGIGVSDYSISGSTVTFKADYLHALHADTYTYWLAATEGAFFSLDVYNSASAPYDVVLSYDEDPVAAFGKFHCDCGGSAADHAYTLDGGARKTADSYCISLGNLSHDATHNFTVYCNSNHTSTSYRIAPSDKALSYFNSRYNFEGRNPDLYMGSIAEFADVIHYLSYGGNIDDSRGDYGVSEITVFIGNDVMPKSGSMSDGLNAMLKAAKAGFTSPYDCAISAAGASFDTDTRMGALTVTITFTSEIAKNRANAITPAASEDSRTLLTANSNTNRTTYIEGLKRTEAVGNVQELADLPMGVRPVFVGTDAATVAAQRTYQAALNVCKTYVSSTMTDVEKLQALYNYLALNVTYDRFALVWFQIQSYRQELEYNAYVGWHNAAISYRNTCSAEEREAIDGVSGYRSAVALTREYVKKSNATFWSNWNTSFNDYEASSLTKLHNYAASLITEAYQGTTLETDVQTFCATTTYAALTADLDNMIACSAFDAQGALCAHVAVCDGISDAFRILCLVEGITCVKVSGQGDNSAGGSEAHAWNKVLVGGEWYCVDATWSSAVNCVSHRYFMVPDSVFVVDHHEQIGEEYRVSQLAMGEEYNYYRETSVAGNTLYVTSLSQLDTTLRALYAAGERTIEVYVASCPTKEAFEGQLSTSSKKFLTPGKAYSYTYTNGYATIKY